jgi:hypothetical protein
MPDTEQLHVMLLSSSGWVPAVISGAQPEEPEHYGHDNGKDMRRETQHHTDDEQLRYP